mgnify:FL=1|jgi:hypothetical protein
MLTYLYPKDSVFPKEILDVYDMYGQITELFNPALAR